MARLHQNLLNVLINFFCYITYSKWCWNPLYIIQLSIEICYILENSIPSALQCNNINFYIKKQKQLKKAMKNEFYKFFYGLAEFFCIFCIFEYRNSMLRTKNKKINKNTFLIWTDIETIFDNKSVSIKCVIKYNKKINYIESGIIKT